MDSGNLKWSENQLTEEQAIGVFNSGIWKDWNAEQVVRFQIFQRRICVDFEHFQECVREVLGRRVSSHEFGFSDDGLMKEYLGEKSAPTLEEIINLIPEEKRFIIGI